jgi:hypothetical protein
LVVQLPAVQVWKAVHAVQVLALAPQAVVLNPSWQVLVESQHPPHVCGLHCFPQAQAERTTDTASAASRSGNFMSARKILSSPRAFKRGMRFLLMVCALVASLARADSPRVLLLWDVKNEQTEALAKSLRTSGAEVVFSETSGPKFNGENPPLAKFDVVVHLNGTTFQEDMLPAGQRALASFVERGGGYVHHEWNAYMLSMHMFTGLRELILFDRTSGFGPGQVTVTKVETAKQQHPVIWEIPKSFTMNGASNIGSAHKFLEYPVQVLAKDSAGNDAIAVRELRLGRIVGFHHSGNWNGMTMLDSGEARRLFVDGVRWAWGCDPNVNAKDLARAKKCEEIKASRAAK